MSKIIHFILFFILTTSYATTLLAQTDRSLLDVQNQKIIITKDSEVNTGTNIPEIKSTIKLQKSSKTDSLLPSEEASSKMQSSKPADKINYSNQRMQRTNESSTNESSKIININEPVFPDLKVEAIEEKSFDNSFVSKEKPVQTIVKAEKIPADKIEKINTSSNEGTISASKRKYLESIVTELENEIQSSANSTSADMLAKKKELEDLKKLLAQ